MSEKNKTQVLFQELTTVLAKTGTKLTGPTVLMSMSAQQELTTAMKKLSAQIRSVVSAARVQ